MSGRAARGGRRAAPARRRLRPVVAGAAPARAKPPPRELDDTALHHLVGYAASRAALELRKVFTAHMAPFDLHVAEFSILMLVASNGDVNQKQLGHALDISPPNMAVTLDRMAESGWIERVRSTHDRRAQHIHLTAKGRALAERTRRISATMEEPALGGAVAGRARAADRAAAEDRRARRGAQALTASSVATGRQRSRRLSARPRPRRRPRPPGAAWRAAPRPRSRCRGPCSRSRIAARCRAARAERTSRPRRCGA